MKLSVVRCVTVFACFTYLQKNQELKRLQDVARCAGHRSRLLILRDELLHQALVQQVHPRAVRAGLGLGKG